MSEHHCGCGCHEPHHANHEHQHGLNCGHTAIKHEGHVDYLHDGHLHHEHNGHYDEHSLDVNATNPDGCHPVQTCAGHVHGEGCGHAAVKHGDHCDNHGPVELA